jgi:23S rRNA (uridine2552-2'-O)-methyltransferase
MAAATTGHAETDHLRTLALAEAAFDLAAVLLAPGGAFVVKLRQGAGEPGFFRALQTRFASVVRAKPAASRSESAELYLVARGFKLE